MCHFAYISSSIFPTCQYDDAPTAAPGRSISDIRNGRPDSAEPDLQEEWLQKGVR